MALIYKRAAPALDSASRPAIASVAGCLPLIHSRMAQESRTRVFTLALLPFEGCERLHQLARGSLQFLPGRFPGEDDFLSPDFQSQTRALSEIQGNVSWPRCSVTHTLWNRPDAEIRPLISVEFRGQVFEAF